MPKTQVKKVKKVAVPLSVKLSAMPSLADMKKALVAVIDGRIEMTAKIMAVSETKVKAIAKIALALCEKTCFFCGNPQGKLGKNFPEKDAPLCACMAGLRSGYREIFVGWEAKAQEIAGRLQKGEIDAKEAAAAIKRAFNGAETVLYGDVCENMKCRKHFTVTSRVVANRLERKGNVRRCTHCHSCTVTRWKEQEARRAAAAQTTEATQPTAPENEAAKKASLKKIVEAAAGPRPSKAGYAKNFRRLPTPEEAAATPLKATLGDILGAKAEA